MLSLFKFYFADWRTYVYLSVFLMLFAHLGRVGYLQEYWYAVIWILVIAPFFEFVIHKYVLHHKVGHVVALPLPEQNAPHMFESYSIEHLGKVTKGRVVAIEDNQMMIGTGLAAYFPELYFYMQGLHYGHHRDPKRLSLIMAPVSAGLAVIAVTFLMGYVIGGFNVPFALTFMCCGALYYLFYEWSHLAHHCQYVPKTRYGQYMRRHHLAHHFKNESLYWGVTNPFADWVFRTAPSVTQIDASGTTKDINA